MQDTTYDQMLSKLGARPGELESAFDKMAANYQQQFKGLLDEQEEEESIPLLREKLEPKYVIVDEGCGIYEFRARWCDMHRMMLSQQEIKERKCDGGGFWGVDGERRLVTLYDSSSDFGFPKHIEEAIRQDGWHLLEILGELGDNKGNTFDLTGYRISYIDGLHVRHYVEYLSEEESDRLKLQQRASQPYSMPEPTAKPHDYQPEERHRHASRQAPKDYAKKRRNKAKQQKQSRKRNKR